MFPGKRDGEGCTLTRGARHLDGRSALLDDAVHRRQAQPGSLAERLGGEERLEDSLAGRLIHPVARVAHDQLDHVRRLTPRLDGQRSAVGHGVARIDHQIHDDLLELPNVSQHEAHPRAQRELKRNVFAQQPRKELQETFDQAIEQERLGVKDLLATEGEQLAGQRSGAGRSGIEFLNIGAQRVAFA